MDEDIKVFDNTSAFIFNSVSSHLAPGLLQDSEEWLEQTEPASLVRNTTDVVKSPGSLKETCEVNVDSKEWFVKSEAASPVRDASDVDNNQGSVEETCEVDVDSKEWFVQSETASPVRDTTGVDNNPGRAAESLKINHVDSLLKTQFSSLPLDVKIEIKKLGPHQPKDFKLAVTYDKYKRNFNTSWFDKKAWLTPSIEKQSLFCFYCLCFGDDGCGGDHIWAKVGCRDLKHFSEKIKKHEESSTHLNSFINYKTFDTVNVAALIDNRVKISIEKHNQQVTKTRHVLSRLIDCLNYCAAHEIGLRGPTETQDSLNRGHFLGLVSMVADLDSVLLDHLNHSSVAKYTSHDIQNELLDCMYSVYLEELKNDINNADFVSVQADETTDISCKSQFVIVFRYIKGSNPVERFVSFVEVHDRTGHGLFEVLKNNLEQFNINNKLIAQTYDGANVMSGHTGGVQTLMQTIFKNAKFVHCYAHQLNSVVKNACSNIKPVKLFFANITGFSSFFSASPKCMDVLKEICDEVLPTVPQTHWNFHSQAVSSVKCHKDQLIECFETIEEGVGWDDVTIREAFALKSLLQNEQFVFFLNFFSDVMLHVNNLYNTIQKQSSNSVKVINSLEHFDETMRDVRIKKYFLNQNSSGLPLPTKRRKTDVNLHVVAKEVCDTIVQQLKIRFHNSEIFSSFSIVDPKLFPIYRAEFPSKLIETFSENYSGLVIKEKLKIELFVIYTSSTFSDMTRVTELYSFFVEHDLKESFSETFKALQITITTPVVTAEAERCFSTLKRIKTFLRNTIGQDGLNALAACSIHKEIISNIPNFNTRVIDLFANRKERAAQLHYK